LGDPLRIESHGWPIMRHYIKAQTENEKESGARLCGDGEHLQLCSRENVRGPPSNRGPPSLLFGMRSDAMRDCGNFIAA